MNSPICMEDRIAEQLKDVCNYKATYIVRFNYGSIEVEEVHDDKPKLIYAKKENVERNG